MRARIGFGHAAGDLATTRPLGQKREQHRLGVGFLRPDRLPVDAPPIDPRRGASLQPPERQVEVRDPFGEPHGRLVTEGPIAALKGPGGRVFELRIKGDIEAFVHVLEAAGMECRETDEDVMRVYVPDGGTGQQLFQIAARHGVQVRHLRPSVPTLEDVFARAVGDT